MPQQEDASWSEVKVGKKMQRVRRLKKVKEMNPTVICKDAGPSAYERAWVKKTRES